MTTQAKPYGGHWAAYYINRDGSWSVACDALGRIIRCETEELALLVARYRHRRLRHFVYRSQDRPYEKRFSKKRPHGGSSACRRRVANPGQLHTYVGSRHESHAQSRCLPSMK
jgi:hypothetical protein